MGKIPKTTVMAISASAKAMLSTAQIPQEKIDVALAAFFDNLTGKGVHSITNTSPLDRVLTPKQTSALLHRSATTVRDMASRGLLRRVFCGAKCKRCAGYTENSIRAFLAGKEVA